jgi:hypothetical protein
MVPKTRNPIPSPTLPLTTPDQAAQLSLHAHAKQSGLLDMHARQNPVQATLMRAIPTTTPTNRTGGVAGLQEPTNLPLFNDTANVKRHVFTDLYPISRLQKLVTERSNVFAVYTTIALFEFDPVTGDIGKEYGIDNGQNERFKAFYLIDRSIPVGFRIGEDHNIENTILVRRILSQ